MDDDLLSIAFSDSFEDMTEIKKVFEYSEIMENHPNDPGIFRNAYKIIT